MRTTFRGSNARNEFLKKIPLLVPDKLEDELYTLLYNEGRLDRFKAIIQFCSSKGLSIAETVERLKKALPGYLSNKMFNIEVFVEMLKNHTDIAEAWGYGTDGDEITKILIKNKAIDIALSSNSLDDIEKLNKMYYNDNIDLKHENKDNDRDGNKDLGVSRDTANDINKLLNALNNIDELLAEEEEDESED